MFKGRNIKTSFAVANAELIELRDTSIQVCLDTNLNCLLFTVWWTPLIVGVYGN